MIAVTHGQPQLTVTLKHRMVQRMRKARLSAGIVLGVAAIMTPLAMPADPASAASPNPNAPESVAAGISVASLPGATVFGSTPADTPETVSFILRERNLNVLQAQAQQGFRRYLSVSQFASVYGQSTANISALTKYLAKYGIETDVYGDNVDVSATGTAGDFDAALSVTQKQYHVPAFAARGGLNAIPAQNVHGIATPPLLPYRLSNFVLAILGLTNYGPYASQAVHVNSHDVKPRAGSSDACVALTGLPNACNLPSDFASNYDLNGLYNEGADGAGQTLAIVTLAAVDPDAPQYFWDNIAMVPDTGRSFTVQNIDGGPGAPSDASGTGETDLDLEQSGSLAYGANVIDYQAPNTDPGFADSFFTAASQNTASTVSSSWGESETIVAASILAGQEASTYLAAFNEAFLEFAAQGQSGFLSAADSGAYDASGDIGTTNLSVDSSANSPYMTAAGGTTLPWTGTLTGPDGSATVTVPAQRAWGWDYLWPAIAQINDESEATAAEANIGGGGGGFSVLQGSAAYQLFVPGTHNYHAVRYLTPTDYETIVAGLVEPTAWNFTPAPSVTSGSGHGRAVPDMSADADPYSGYELYEPSFAGVDQPVLQGAWGGTSFVAPQFNGSTAVIDSALGHRVGLLNPAIYATARGHGSPFNPLATASTSNDNLYYTGNPGQVYNEAVGLGIPDLAKLAVDLG
jgi:kumamolisin